MITGPEATIVTRASGAVVRGVKERATATRDWPSLHAGLMELSAILTEWINAARATHRLIKQKLEGEELPKRRTGWLSALNFGPMRTDVMPSNVGIIRDIKVEVREQLTPKVSLVKNLTPQQRRAAARRTLRNVMNVYCPELLADFEAAVERRVEWVEANRAALIQALDSESADEQSLITWEREADVTQQGLVDMQAQLIAFITDTFPAQVRSPWG
ncbi:hypothetical protein [Streptomyces sp. NPDC001307]|uniref:hypothetical protein n=1 Tax=Streptomyces sp. NPDC001307 TaxID=3364560 RepID=UPI00368229FE